MKKRTDKKEWTGVQEAKGMPKSHSTLEREESDPRKRNSEPEGFLLIHRVAMEQGHHTSEETNHQDEFISKARQCQRVGHYSFAFSSLRSFPSGSDGKESACNAGDPGLINGYHSSILAWRIPWSVLLAQWSVSHSVVSDCLQVCGLQPTRLLHPWNSPGKTTGVGGHFLLQGMFPTQGLNLGLCMAVKILYYLSHQGSPITMQ